MTETEFLTHVIEITSYGHGLNLQPPKPKDPVASTLAEISSIAASTETGDDTPKPLIFTFPEQRRLKSGSSSE